MHEALLFYSKKKTKKKLNQSIQRVAILKRKYFIFMKIYKHLGLNFFIASTFKKLWLIAEISVFTPQNYEYIHELINIKAYCLHMWKFCCSVWVRFNFNDVLDFINKSRLKVSEAKNLEMFIFYDSLKIFYWCNFSQILYLIVVNFTVLFLKKS